MHEVGQGSLKYAVDVSVSIPDLFVVWHIVIVLCYDVGGIARKDDGAKVAERKKWRDECRDEVLLRLTCVYAHVIAVHHA